MKNEIPENLKIENNSQKMIVNKSIQKMINEKNLKLGEKNKVLSAIKNMIHDQLADIVRTVAVYMRSKNRKIVNKEAICEAFQTDFKDLESIGCDEKAIVTRYLLQNFKNNGMMIASGDNSPVKQIKLRLYSRLINVINKIEYVTKTVASKTILKMSYVKAALQMV